MSTTKDSPQNSSSGGKRQILRNITTFLTSNFKIIIKGTLAYWLSFLIIFNDESRNYFKNPQVLNNIILPTIVLNVAVTLGAFIQTATLLILGILIGGLLFVLEAGVFGNSVAAMIILLIVVVYLSSIIRSTNARYFGFGLIVCVLLFQGIFTRITSGMFKESYLNDSIVAFLIGIAIAWTVNLIIWPTTAERKLTSQICVSLTHLSSFHTLLLKQYLHSLNDNEACRIKSLSTQIRSDAVSLVRIIDELEAEITYSKFSIKEYKEQVRCINLMQSHLVGLYYGTSKKCRRLFDKDALDSLKENATELSEVCRKSIISIKYILDPEYRKDKNVTKECDLEKSECVNEKVEELHEEDYQESLQGSLKAYEDKQRSIMINLLHLDDITLEDVYNKSASDNDSIITFESDSKVQHDDDIFLKGSTWEEIFFNYFFTFGFKEYVEELFKLGEIVNKKKDKKKRLRINYKWMVPKFFSKKKTLQNKSDDYHSFFAMIRVKLAKFLYTFKSSVSLSSIKASIALVVIILPLLIGGSAKDFFVKWNLSSGVVSILVLISPVIGQTYLTLSLMIIGTVLGSIWAYISLIVWKSNLYGLSFFIILYDIPFSYLANSPRTIVVSILSRISYAGVFVPQFIIMKNNIPNANSPIVATYKNLVVTALAIILAFILQVFVYPNLARQELRKRLSNISVNMILYFEEFATIYNKILSNTSLTQTQREDELQKVDNDLRHVELKIQRALIKIQPLFIYSSTEPRLIAPFPVLKYEIIMVHLRHILDRISWARLIVMGKKTFSDKTVQDLIIPLQTYRTQLQSIIVVLMYLYANALVSKQPLPHILPKSTELKDNLLNESIRLVKELTINETEKRKRNEINEDEESVLKNPEYIRFYAISSIMGGISHHIDAIGDVLKDLFGETVGYA